MHLPMSIVGPVSAGPCGEAARCQSVPGIRRSQGSQDSPPASARGSEVPHCGHQNRDSGGFEAGGQCFPHRAVHLCLVRPSAAGGQRTRALLLEHIGH